MPNLYRIMRPNGLAAHIGSLDAVEKVVANGGTGCYPIEEVDLDMLAARTPCVLGTSASNGPMVQWRSSLIRGQRERARIPWERSTPSADLETPAGRASGEVAAGFVSTFFG